MTNPNSKITLFVPQWQVTNVSDVSAKVKPKVKIHRHLCSFSLLLFQPGPSLTTELPKLYAKISAVERHGLHGRETQTKDGQQGLDFGADHFNRSNATEHR